MLYSASPSRLTGYLDCPRRYRYTYLDRPTPAKGPPWAHNTVGAAVHLALSRWWDQPLERRTPDTGGALLVASWSDDGFRDAAQSLDHRERAREQVEGYLATVDPTAEPVGIERGVAVRTPRAALRGRVDRIDDRPGEGLVVVDYKTGRRPPAEDEARTSLALAVYAAGAATVFRRPCVTVELHHLPSDTVQRWTHTPESLDRHLRRADGLCAELADLDSGFKAGLSEAESETRFPAEVGPLCGWCDFRAVCPEGQRVAAREPWAGVAD